MATEWIVEAKAGGTCIVRVVHSWFASTDEWDGQFEMVEQGWGDFFNILRLKLEHFAGLPGAAFGASGMSNASESEAWKSLAELLGLPVVGNGQDVRSCAGAPPLAGKVAIAGNNEGSGLMLLVHEPGTGVCHLSAIPMGGPTYLSIRFYLFGDNAASAAAASDPEWNRWFAERFPMEG